MRDEGLPDEYSLQSWFIGRINEYLIQRGKRLIGWDEILEGGLNPGTLVMSWRVSPFFPVQCLKSLEPFSAPDGMTPAESVMAIPPVQCRANSFQPGST